MSRSAFQQLLDIFRKGISSFVDAFENEESRQHRFIRCKKAQSKHSTALWVLAGGSVHAISLDFDVGVSSVYFYLHNVFDAINKPLPLSKLHTDRNAMKKCAIWFATSPITVHQLPGFIGAVYGITIGMEKPKNATAPHPSSVGKGTSPFLCNPWWTPGIGSLPFQHYSRVRRMTAQRW